MRKKNKQSVEFISIQNAVNFSLPVTRRTYLMEGAGEFILPQRFEHDFSNTSRLPIHRLADKEPHPGKWMWMCEKGTTAVGFVVQVKSVINTKRTEFAVKLVHCGIRPRSTHYFIRLLVFQKGYASKFSFL